MSSSSTKPAQNYLSLSTTGPKAPAENSTPDYPNLESDITNPSFPLPRPIFNEDSTFFSNGPAYHPSETAGEETPLHIARHGLDPKSASSPHQFRPMTPSPTPLWPHQPVQLVPTAIFSPILTLSLPHHHPIFQLLRIPPYFIRSKSICPLWVI